MMNYEKKRFNHREHPSTVILSYWAGREHREKRKKIFTAKALRTQKTMEEWKKEEMEEWKKLQSS